MLERFMKEARRVAESAEQEARGRGSSTIEAEHLLLALAQPAGGLASQTLSRAGLDHEALLDALESELERSLDTVGVTTEGLHAPVPSFAGRPRWGASAKASFERTMEAAHTRGDRRIGPAHILLGVLEAREGTVPRTLRGAGVEPSEIVAETQAAMDRA